MTANTENLVWLDLEMTGLDPKKNKIIEIATIITDKDLTILANGPSLVIYQPESILQQMDAWCVGTHGKSGLTNRALNSQISTAVAEGQTLNFLRQWTVANSSPLCGNSIGTDRQFLAEYMPELEKFFHYRNLDVSTLKELAKRWKPEVLTKINKTNTHLALVDIQESIAELAIYREHLFNL